MFLRCRKRYGAPRLVRKLRDEGHISAKKAVARTLREEGLVARRATPFVCTTDSAHEEPIAPNVLARRFAVEKFAILDLAWVGDMTYISPRTAWWAGRRDRRSRRTSRSPRCSARSRRGNRRRD